MQLAELKSALSRIGKDDPDKIAEELENVDGDIAIVTLIKYFSSLTVKQNTLFTSLTEKFAEISQLSMDTMAKVLLKVEDLESNAQISEKISKNQQELAETVKLMQKSLASAQKFNKEAIFQLAREISSVNVVNSKNSPIPIEIDEDLQIAHAISSKVISYARVNGEKLPSVVELGYSDGSKKLLTISRDGEGDYMGHTLKAVLKS